MVLMSSKQICCSLLLSLVLLAMIGLEFSQSTGSCMSAVHDHEEDHDDDHHHCSHHDHDHHSHHHHLQTTIGDEKKKKLPEELAEEEDLKLYGLGFHHHHHDYHHDGAALLSGLGLWINAMGCSLLVSLASLICLIILPLLFIHGKPSKTVVDSLAVFGAGAMLGDAFLHQLPHAFGGEHTHSHDHHANHVHSGLSHSHSHSLEDLSVGLSILAGIVLFLVVEKVVRYVDIASGGLNVSSHSHQHYRHKNSKKLDGDDNACENLQRQSPNEKDGSVLNTTSEQVLQRASSDNLNEKKESESALVRKRTTSTSAREDKLDFDLANDSSNSAVEKEPSDLPSSLVFGYLNLFSDGVHNFTDGMALGSAFLLYGSVGGWSRTLFLLAHELPQEIGDFGILVRSGFSVSKALFFNFLSALVALAGTALALLWGQDPGQSSLIEGFTAGGFIYIAVAGVLAEMNNGSSSLKSSAIQLISLILGMTVALCISLVE